MAFLIDIGTGLVGKLVDYTVVAVGHQIGYLIFYSRNIKSLEDKLTELIAENARVEQILLKESRNLREADDPVTNWLIDAKNITGEVNDILNQRYKETLMPLCGVFPNLVVRHQISRTSIKLVSDVAELYDKRKNFETYAHDINPQDVPSRDYETFSSRTKVVDEIMDYFRNNPDDNLIGVYGLGGIGKTTLVKEVARQATQDKTMFQDVALILDVKQNPSIQRIQKEIAEKLGLEFPTDETPAGRARRLSTRIKDHKTLVILDDVWERIDLEAVGLSGATTCKVLLTSRTRDVLSGKMQTQKEFPLDLLGEEESWNLFQKKAGDVVEVPSIKAVATKVAKKCGGLPVLVVTVASALRNKSNLHAWKDALRRLKRFDKEEDREKAYLTLEWSYSQLKNEELKQIFLLCGLLADSLKEMYIRDLFKYAIGLGLFKNHNTLGEAWAAVNTLFEKLKDSCLLLDHEDSRCLKMHDIVYDVANRILSRDHMLKISDGDEFTEWPDNNDFCDKCTMISLQTSNYSSIPKLPEVLKCKELKVFLLMSEVKYDSLDIPCDFFKETERLGVLDLNDLIIPSLPSSMKFLKNLKTLCFGRCKLGDIALIGQLRQLEVLYFLASMFKELPKEVANLKNLRSLDLTHCSELEIIAPGVISNLKRLEELKMGNSFNQWKADEEGIINSEKSNASLSELECLSKLSILHIHILDANILPRNLFSSSLERFQIYIGADWKWDDVDENVNILKIKLTTTDEVNQSGVNMLLKITDELHLNGMEAGTNAAHQLDGDAFHQLKYLHVHKTEFRHIINGKDVFPNLQRLVVNGLDSSEFFLSASEARRLVQLSHLQISGCPTMEGIISTNASDENHIKDIFSKLQHLELKDLPSLTKFCSRIDTGYQSLEVLQPENNEIVDVMRSGEEMQDSFFNEEVVFPSLKTLIINGLTKSMKVWHHLISPECFKNIETVNISGCPKLKSVFPISMVTRLQNLKHLKVERCGVEEIIADGVQTTDELVFPRVISLKFSTLWHLNGFYKKMHVSLWPSLQELYVSDCSKVTFLAQEYSSLQRNYESKNPAPTNQALFSVKKGSFPNLKQLTLYDMEIWDGLFPVPYFPKLEYFEFGNRKAESAAILEKFTGQEKYGETSAPPHFGIYSHWKSTIEDIPLVETLTHLSDLWLCNMPRMIYLGEDHSQGVAGQNFPNLKFLGINCCDSLRNLRSSAISFKNLTNLQVSDCLRLEYLITLSTAISFNQLKVLSVENCGRLVQIVGSTEEEDNAGTEIVFSGLKYLELSNLPRLRSFCFKHCIVKLPSLEQLLISKRLKSKIFHNGETLQVTDELADTDVDSDRGETCSDTGDVETGVYADDGEKLLAVQVTKENVDRDGGADGDQSDETTHTISNVKDDKIYIESEHVQPLEINTTDEEVIAPMKENLAILPVAQGTALVYPVFVSYFSDEATRSVELVVDQVFSDIESQAEDARPDLHQIPSTQVQLIIEQNEHIEPAADATGISVPIIHEPAPPSSQEYVQPLDNVETFTTDQRFIAPVEETPAIIQAGEAATPVFPVIEHPPVVEVPHTEEVGEPALGNVHLEPLAEAARLDVHQTRNAAEQHVGKHTSATVTPTLTIPALLPSSGSKKSTEAKFSLREKLQALSAKKAATNSGLSEEAKTKLKVLIATADLKDLNTRQQLLTMLPDLQLSTTKWIADLAVQELVKLQLVMDKEKSLCQELAAHIAHGSELDVRSQCILSEGSAAEQNFHRVEEHKAELLVLREQIKKLEAQATSLQDQITVLENKHFCFEASLDQLDEEHQVNQLYVESTSQELLRTQAESASLSTAIFTYLRQLL